MTDHRETVIEFLGVAVDARHLHPAAAALDVSPAELLVPLGESAVPRAWALPEEPEGVFVVDADGFVWRRPGRTIWFRVLRDDTLDDAEREDWAGLLGHYGPLREATPADLARVGLGGTE